MKTVLIFNDTRADEHFGCELVMRSLEQRLRARGLQPVTAHRVGEDCERQLARAVAQYPQAVAAVVNGEGSIHHGNERARSLVRIAAALRQRAGLPSYLVNASLFDNPPDLLAQLADFRRVYVRESESRDAARAQGIDAALCADLTFDAMHLDAGPAPARAGWLVTDSVRKSTSRELRELARAIDGRWLPMRESRRILGLQWSRRRRGDFFAAVRAAGAVLTGRFHTVTTCIATATPFWCLRSNTRKVEALLHDVFGDSGRRLMDSVDAMRAGLPGAAPAPDRIGFDAAELAAVAAYQQRANERIAAMFDRIAADLG